MTNFRGAERRSDRVVPSGWNLSDGRRHASLDAQLMSAPVGGEWLGLRETEPVPHEISEQLRRNGKPYGATFANPVMEVLSCCLGLMSNEQHDAHPYQTTQDAYCDRHSSTPFWRHRAFEIVQAFGQMLYGHDHSAE
jgi:hypothetical protein